MIYVTGDVHGDFTRFSSDNFPEPKGMTKADYVLICGDFGGLWDGSKRERYWLGWLERKPFTTLFVSGNHENYDLLAELPVAQWRGGRVQFLRPSILHLMRGQVYELVGKRLFAMGGAASHDIADGILDPAAPNFRRQKRRLEARRAQYRVNRQSWWAEELPSDAQYAEAERNLAACGYSVDFIVTHCCPSGIANSLDEGQYRPDRLTDYFAALAERCRFRYWFFGHYHDNRVIQQRYILLYEQIIRAV